MVKSSSVLTFSCSYELVALEMVRVSVLQGGGLVGPFQTHQPHLGQPRQPERTSQLHHALDCDCAVPAGYSARPGCPLPPDGEGEGERDGKGEWERDGEGVGEWESDGEGEGERDGKGVSIVITIALLIFKSHGSSYCVQIRYHYTCVVQTTSHTSRHCTHLSGDDLPRWTRLPATCWSGN